MPAGIERDFILQENRRGNDGAAGLLRRCARDRAPILPACQIVGTITHRVLHPCSACEQCVVLDLPLFLHIHMVILVRIFRSFARARPSEARGLARGRVAVPVGIAVADAHLELVFRILVAQLVDVLLALAVVAEIVRRSHRDIAGTGQADRSLEGRGAVELRDVGEGIVIRIAIGVVHVVVVERAVVVKGIAQIEEGVFALFLLGAAAADDIFPVGGLAQISRGGSWSGPCLDRRCDEIACPAVRGALIVTETEGKSALFSGDLHAALPCMVAAVRNVHLSVNSRLFLVLRDDVDDAGDGMTAVERGAGAAHDFDTFDVVERDGIPVDAAAERVVELLPVVHDEDIRAAKAAQGQAILRVRCRRDVDACLPF